MVSFGRFAHFEILKNEKKPRGGPPRPPPIVFTILHHKIIKNPYMKLEKVTKFRLEIKSILI